MLTTNTSRSVKSFILHLKRMSFRSQENYHPISSPGQVTISSRYVMDGNGNPHQTQISLVNISFRKNNI